MNLQAFADGFEKEAVRKSLNKRKMTKSDFSQMKIGEMSPKMIAILTRVLTKYGVKIPVNFQSNFKYRNLTIPQFLRKIV